MVEAYFFFVWIPLKIRKVAKPRGASTIGWTLLSWLAWLAVEMGIVLVVIGGLMASRALLDWPKGNLVAIIGAAGYLAGLAGGMTAADRVRARLAMRPVLDASSQNE